jgi:hypothetical protein
MDRPKRRNMVIDLRVMDDKIRLWLGAEDMDQDDRQALETVRDVISDLISRPGWFIVFKAAPSTSFSSQPGVAQPLPGTWMVPSKRPGPAGRTADPGLSGCGTRDRARRFTAVLLAGEAHRRGPTRRARRWPGYVNLNHGPLFIRASAFRLGQRIWRRELGIRPQRAFRLPCNVLRLHPGRVGPGDRVAFHAGVVAAHLGRVLLCGA